MAEERVMAEDRRNERCDGQCATEGGAGAHGAETPPRGGSGLTPEVVVPDRELGAYRRKMRLIEFTHSSTRATVLMVAAALVALFIENVPFLPALADFWHDASVGFTVGGFTAQMSVGHFVNDFLMACFFLLVGLEIKREMVAGESPSRARRCCRSWRRSAGRRFPPSSTWASRREAVTRRAGASRWRATSPSAWASSPCSERGSRRA